nr:hypothetical protein [Tanacetum cinerariifolium]
MIDMIDWINPEGERFHNNLSKPLPLVGPPGKKTIPTRYFFNHDLEYLRHGNEEKKYALSVTKIKAARYKQEGIEELIPYIGSPSIHKYDRNVELVEKKYGYEYLKEIVVHRVDQMEYMFVEAVFPRLNQNDIEDFYLLKIQNKIHNIYGVDEFDLINAFN